MRIGTIGYATHQGLGILTKAFMDHGVCTDIMVVRHPSRESHHEEWYPGAPVTNIRPFDWGAVVSFIQNMDAMLFIETPFHWDLIKHCRTACKPTVLMPMYECMPYPLPAVPDKIINPSLLDQDYYPQGTFIPVPVEVPVRRVRERAHTFVHNAGHGGLKGRNGTAELLAALPLVKSPIRLILRTQDPLTGSIPDDPRLEVYVGTVPTEQLYDEGDVFIFPEKFNGLSLPLQEAYASGMMVMAGDRHPINTWLPKDPLIPVSGYRKNRIGSCNEFYEAVFTPERIAATIDHWYDREISSYSLEGLDWGARMSWEELKPNYMSVLCE